MRAFQSRLSLLACAVILLAAAGVSGQEFKGYSNGGLYNCEQDQPEGERTIDGPTGDAGRDGQSGDEPTMSNPFNEDGSYRGNGGLVKPNRPDMPSMSNPFNEDGSYRGNEGLVKPNRPDMPSMSNPFNEDGSYRGNVDLVKPNRPDMPSMSNPFNEDGSYRGNGAEPSQPEEERTIDGPTGDAGSDGQSCEQDQPEESEHHGHHEHVGHDGHHEHHEHHEHGKHDGHHKKPRVSDGCNSNKTSSEKTIEELQRLSGLNGFDVLGLRAKMSYLLNLSVRRQCVAYTNWFLPPADESQLVARALEDVMEQESCFCQGGMDGYTGQQGGHRGCTDDRPALETTILELQKKTGLNVLDVLGLRNQMSAMLNLSTRRHCKSYRDPLLPPADESQLVVRALEDILKQQTCVCEKA